MNIIQEYTLNSNTILSLFRRCIKSFFNRPIKFIDSINKSSIIKFFNSSPLFKTMSFSVVFYRLTNSSIIRLFFPSSPSAIFFRIVFIVVYTVNSRIFYSKHFRMYLVRFIHIIFKFFERIPNYFDSTPTIILIKKTFLRITSIFYIRICLSKFNILPIIIYFYKRHNFIPKLGIRFAGISLVSVAKLIMI